MYPARKFSFGSKTKRINVLEEKVEALSNDLGSVITNNYELKKSLNKLEVSNEQLNKEYTQIKTNKLPSKKHKPRKPRNVTAWKGNG